jgi:formate/nitrite transporter FocA (FNT family)
MKEIAESRSCHSSGWVREDVEKSVEAIPILYILQFLALIVLGNFVDGLVMVWFGTLWCPPGAPSSRIIFERPASFPMRVWS